MRKFVTPAMIMSWRPCSRWSEAEVRAAFHGRSRMAVTVLLRRTDIAPQDRLWVALREEVCSSRTLRLFAADCAERALDRLRASGLEPDARSWSAIDVCRRFALKMVRQRTAGRATGRLAEAWDIANDAAYDTWAAAYTAWAAADDTVAAATAKTAFAASRTAAWAAAWAAAEAANGAAEAARAAASAAASAVGGVARAMDADAAAEGEWQCGHLAEMIEAA